MPNARRTKKVKQKSTLPKQVCVLDIETADLNFKKRSLNEATIAIVGVKVFALVDGDYAPQEYRCFRADQMEALGAFLAAFPGIVVGHNILEFDYQVLRRHIPLEGIVERTADTLYFLHGKNDKVLNGLSLDNLCTLNFGEGKTLSGKSVPLMWQQGKQEEVIRYNEADCDLTMRLWREMVKERVVCFLVYEDGPDITELTEADVAPLTCEKPMFTYAAWEKKLAKEGRLMERYFRRRTALDPELAWEAFDPLAFFGQEVEYQTFYCDQCDQTLLFECRIVRGFGEYEKACCPTCKKELGEVRDDVGTPTTLGSLPGNVGRSVFQGLVEGPFEAIIRERIEATRPQWEKTPETLPLMEERCLVCNRLPPATTGLRVNPVDGSPICMECLSAGRWLLTVK